MSINRDHARLMRRATAAALATAILLALSKAVAWWLSGSVSLLAGLTDSLLDGAASLLNLLAVHYSLRPADDDHRYGHGKAEALAGLAQSAFITGSAVLVLLQGINRLLHPEPLEAAWAGIAVMVFSIIATLALLAIQKHVIARTNSTAVGADSLHYKSDLLLNLSIIVALLLAQFGIQRADALFGLGIALFIGYGAVRIGLDAIQILMDHELPDEVRAEALRIARAVPDVIDVHELRTRESGQHWFMQLHLELPATLTLADAHARGEQVRLAIVERFPQADVLVHKDPA